MAKKKKRDDGPVEGQFLSMRKYGAHRKERGLPGHSHTAVSNAIKSGRLTESVHQTEKGMRIDPIAADREWEDNSQEHKRQAPAGGRPKGGQLFGDESAAPARPPAGTSATMQRTQLAKAILETKLKRLDLEVRQGRLVELALVKSEAFRVGRTLREYLLQLPERLADDLAGMDDVQAIIALLAEEMTLALQQFETFDVDPAAA